MKRVAIITVGVLFFLAILGLILLKLFAPTKTPIVTQQIDPFKDIPATTQFITNDTPYRTAISCYTWYTQAYTRAANAHLIASRPEAQSCFTTRFINDWQNLIDSTGSDPVVLSQDYGPTWLNALAVSTIGQSIHSADEQVTIGSAGDPNQVTLTAHLTQLSDGTWRIDSVSQ